MNVFRIFFGNLTHDFSPWAWAIVALCAVLPLLILWHHRRWGDRGRHLRRLTFAAWLCLLTVAIVAWARTAFGVNPVLIGAGAVILFLAAIPIIREPEE